MKHYVKMYPTPQGMMLASCDEDILGKSYSQGDLRLDVKESFYGGDIMDSQGLANSLNSASIANLVGEHTVAVAIDIGLIDESCIMNIQNTPHAQFVRC